MLLRLLVVVACIVLAAAQTPPPVCQELRPTDATTRPVKISPEFSVDVEVVSRETGRVINMVMYYSQSRQKIRLSLLDGGQKSDIFFYFADDEMLTFDYSSGRGKCSVVIGLKNNPQTFIAGGVKPDGKIQVPLAVLHFMGPSGFGGDIVTTYLGPDTIRDMPVHKFYSCQRWSFGNKSAIVNVTHYFSDKNWSRPNAGTVPVMVEVHGSLIPHSETATIDHTYNFFNFKEALDPTVFETPPGVVCEGRKVDMPFPNLPTYLKLSAEVIDHPSGNVFYVEEIYDADDQLAVMRSQGFDDIGTGRGMNHYTYIRDYPTGLSYTINNKMGTCIVQNITQSIVLPFDTATPEGKARELTPDEFFYGKNTTFYYLGERQVRGLTTDTWVAKTRFAGQPREEVIVEWYFAKPGVRSWNDGSPYYVHGKFRIPVLFRLWTQYATESVDTALHHADFTKIMYGVLDIRACYPERASNYFQLVMEGAKQHVVSTNLEQFKWAAAATIANAAGVRLLRITDLQVYYDQDDTVLEFELLDAPPYASDIDEPSTQDANLQDATNNLHSAVQDGTLTIKVWDSESGTISKPVTVTKSAHLLANERPETSSDNGFSIGAVVGLAVAMAVVGGAGGAAGAFFLIK